MGRDAAKPYSILDCLSAHLLCMMLLLCMTSFGQEAQIQQSNALIKGHLYDSTQKRSCTNVVAALLSKDSTLLAFIRSQKDGNFQFDHLAAGTYIVLFTHPAYNEYSFLITVLSGEIKELGKLSLPPKSDLLAAVTVTPTTVNPHMRGDTLEYNTGHLRLQPNASVEELLKRLPGVQVDRNGVIRVNGQRIERLLVDGEDFFNGNPTLVTRNFNADMIAKVQVLDKKSKKAEFTGIQDGQKTRTINLALKEDSKQGYFINGQVGHDLTGHYKINGLLGSFRNRQQLAALAMGANDGASGANDLSGGIGANVSLQAATDPLGASAGTGVPTILGGGAHYANHWGQNDAHLSGNYQYGRLQTAPSTGSIIIQTLPDSIYTQTQLAHSLNNQDQHSLTADLELKVDSLNSVKLTFSGNQVQGHNTFNAAGSSSFNDTLVNSSRRQVLSDVRNNLFDANVMWSRRDRKNPRRLFSFAAGFNSRGNTTNGMLYALNSFYKKDGSIDRADTVDQRKAINSRDLGFHADIGYGAPLWRGGGFTLGYGVGYIESQSLLNTFGKDHNTYDVYIDSLSNQYRNTLFTQTFTLGVYGNLKKLRYQTGLGVSHTTNAQRDLFKSTDIRYQYTNLNPSLNLNWDLNMKKGFTLDYKGASLQPSITQLQPITNNNDPLHITLGNPDLHQSFSHSIEMSYRIVGPVMINLGSRLNFMTNSFGTKTYTDSLGRQVSQTVNVDGARAIGAFTYFSYRIKKLALDVNFNPYCYYTRNVNYVNSILDHNDGINSGAGLGFNKYVPDKYNIQVQFLTGYLTSHSSINPAAAFRYWTETDNFSLSLYFLHGMEINTSGDYSWRQKVSSMDKNNSVFIWNAFVSKNFFSNRLGVRWQISDILNRNAGITRDINSNTVTQNTYNVIGRYWLFSLSYRFMHHSQAGKK